MKQTRKKSYQPSFQHCGNTSNRIQGSGLGIRIRNGMCRPQETTHPIPSRVEPRLDPSTNQKEIPLVLSIVFSFRTTV